MRTKALSRRLENEIADLKRVLLEEDRIDTETRNVHSESAERSTGVSAKVAVRVGELAGNASGGAKSSTEAAISERFTRSKLDLLHRRIIEYQKIVRDLASLSCGDSYLVLDDLYHIRRSDQPRVIDYFRRLGKSAGLWIKIGTIRHRSSWYVNGDPP